MIDKAGPNVRPTQLRRAIIGLLVVLTVISLPVNAGAAGAKVLASWSQITGTDADPAAGGALAPLNVEMRFVVDTVSTSKNVCSDYEIAVDGKSTPVAVRWARRTNTASFSSITVCHATMDSGWSIAHLVDDQGKHVKNDKGQEVIFPGPAQVGVKQSKRPTNPADELIMVVFGDSGCRGYDGQTCQSNTFIPWSFADLVNKAAAAVHEPDFVVHVGDYRYRNQGTVDWDVWYDDFFAAAQPMLSRVPWALTRGNHEECTGGYAGRGWFLFFGRGKQTDCPGGGARTLEKPWYFDVAVRSKGPVSQAHRFIVLDTAPTIRSSSSHWKDQVDYFEKGMDWAQAAWSGNTAASAWFVMHKPLWGLASYHPPKQEDRHVGDALAAALQSAGGSCVPYSDQTCGLKAVLSGHQHSLQNVVFQGKSNRVLPQQFVVGNSGVKLRGHTINHPCKKNFNDAGFKASTTKCADGSGTCLDGRVVDWYAKSGPHHNHYDFGFVTWTRSAAVSGEQSGWSGVATFTHRSAAPLGGQMTGAFHDSLTACQ